MTEPSWDVFGPLHYQPPSPGGRKAPVEFQRPSVAYLSRRDGLTCAYCGVVLETKGAWDSDPDWPPAPTIDHVVPRHRGGGDTNYNTVLACIHCNLVKATRHPALMFA